MPSTRRRLRRAAFLVVGSLLLLVAAVVVRLANGPIDLEAFRPRMERALSARDGSFRVRLSALQVAWDTRDRELALRATSVHVLGRDGGILLEVPVVGVRLAAGPLLRGRIAPAEIRLAGPRLTIVRATDGRLELPASEPVDLGGVVGALASGGEGPPTTPSLRRLSAHGVEITLLDQRSGRTWRLTGADLVLEPNAPAPAGSLAGRLEMAPYGVPVRLAARYRPDRDRGVVRLGFRHLLPEMLADLPLWDDDEAARRAAGTLRMPLDGTVVISTDSGFRPVAAHGHARGGPGEVRLASQGIDPIALTGLRVRGRLDVAASRADVPVLSVAVGTSRVHASGGVSWAGDAVSIDAVANAERVPLDALGRWWPPTAAPAARRWVVDRRSGGMATTSELELHATVERESRRAEVHVPRATVRFEGATVRYHDRLPAVTDVGGKVQLDDRGWTLHAERGRTGAIEVTGASGVFPVRGHRRSRPQLTAELLGPLPEALAILDREPFGYARALGVTPEAVTGTGTARVTIEGTAAGSGRPVAVSGRARLQGVATSGIAGGLTLSDGDISLEFEPGRLGASGTARLEGTPMSVTWNEDFTARRGSAREVLVKGRVDSEGRRRLGLDLTPWLDGPVDVEARLATSGGNGGVDVEARLDDATIGTGLARLAKPAGAPGRATGRLTLAGSAVTAVERLTVEAGPATVTGTAERDGAGWERARFQATLAGDAAPGQCVLTVERQPRGHDLRLTSDDAGTLLLSLFGERHLRGGRLTIDGRAEPSDAGPTLAGSLDVRDVVLVRSPVFVRFAKLASLSGVLNALDRSGLPFDRVQTAFRYAQPVLTLADGLATGPEIAFAIDGTIDRVAATADLRGTAVPSYYGLNTAPGRIPVLGKVVGDQGIQGIDFRVTGALADAKVSVSPVSAILPGRLRNVLRPLQR